MMPEDFDEEPPPIGWKTKALIILSMVMMAFSVFGHIAVALGLLGGD